MGALSWCFVLSIRSSFIHRRYRGHLDTQEHKFAENNLSVGNRSLLVSTLDYTVGHRTRHHAATSIDLFVVHTISFKRALRLVVLSHARRRLVRIAVISNPNIVVFGEVLADTHCTNVEGVNRTERAVAVANQVPRRLVPGKASLT